MLGPLTFTFTLESEEFDKSEKVGCAAAADLYQTMITTRAPDGAKNQYSNWALIVDLHGCQDQQDGEIDLDDHVDVLLSEETRGEADDDKEDGWDEHGQQVVDDGSTKGDLGDNGFHFMDG